MHYKLYYNLSNMIKLLEYYFSILVAKSYIVYKNMNVIQFLQ